MKICARCGQNVNDAEQFCSRCGGTQFKVSKATQQNRPVRPQMHQAQQQINQGQQQMNMNQQQVNMNQQQNGMWQQPMNQNTQQMNMNQQRPVRPQLNKSMNNMGMNNQAQFNNQQMQQTQMNQQQMNMNQQMYNGQQMQGQQNNQFQELPPKKKLFMSKGERQAAKLNKQNNPNQQMTQINSDGSSVKDWILTLIFLIIPIYNIVYIIKVTKSPTEVMYKKNYIKAFLIYFAASCVISLIITLLLSLAMTPAV